MSVTQTTVVGTSSPVLETEEARSLLEVGKESGSLSAEEITLALDELDLDAGQIDDFYQALDELQIEVVAAVEADDVQAPVDEVKVQEVSTDALQLFLKDVGRVDLLTAAQEVELAKRIERGDHRAKQEMVEANLRLVVSIAKRYRNQGLPVPRPDPGGDDRSRPGGGEVRLPQGLQVLDLRHLVDPPGGRPGARRQGARRSACRSTSSRS